MSDAKFGVSIQARNAADAVLQIQQAEAAGIVAAWSTIGGAGGDPPLPTFLPSGGSSSWANCGRSAF